jgi:hypothetical protein
MRVRVVLLALLCALALPQVAGTAGGLDRSKVAGPQCGDGLDNDRDRLVDARDDPGCADSADATESTPLTCALRHATSGRSYVIEGSCSGPFGGVDVTAPAGVKLDQSVRPAASFSRGCRFRSIRTLACTMADGAANPGHDVRLRVNVQGEAKGRPLVRFRDVLNRPVTTRFEPVRGGDTAPLGTRSADVRIDVQGPPGPLLIPPHGDVRAPINIAVRNAGPSQTAPFAFELSLRSPKQFLSNIHTDPGMGCRKIKGGYRCEVRNLVSGATQTARMNAFVEEPTTLTVEARVVGLTHPDPVKLSNTDVYRVEIEEESADLAVIAKLDERVISSLPARTTLYFSVHNHGPHAVGALDARLRLEASRPVTAAGCAAGNSPGEWLCPLPRLMGLHSGRVQLTVPAGGPLRVTVTVSSQLPDKRSSNNTSTAETEIVVP